MDALEVLGRELDWRERVLDLVRYLPGHLRPGLEPMRAFELRALRLELRRHAVERVHQPPELVGRLDRDAGIEISSCDPSGRAGETANGVGDALRHR